MMSRAAVDAAIIALAPQGKVTPEMVVEAARDSASPLHPYFTWNVKQAAHERWLEQARDLIASVKYEITTTNYSVRAPMYIRDPTVRHQDQGYISIATLRQDEDLAREAVVMEFARASAALLRAKSVASALGLEAEVEDVRGRVLQLSERASQVA